MLIGLLYLVGSTLNQVEILKMKIEGTDRGLSEVGWEEGVTGRKRNRKYEGG